MKRLTILVLLAATAAPAAAAMPDAQLKFIEIATITRELAGQAKNDMQKGAARAKREELFCLLLRPDLSAIDWEGTVYRVTSNSDGKGVLELEIGTDIYVKTWNNAFSDIFDHTLIEPGSPAFAGAAQTANGQKVRFSGRFIADQEGGCLREGSLTLDGKMDEPEFLFRFDAVTGQ